MLKRPFEWDTVQMPLNVLDAQYDSFQKQVLPVCRDRGISVIGMKGLAAGINKGKRRYGHPSLAYSRPKEYHGGGASLLTRL